VKKIFGAVSLTFLCAAHKFAKEKPQLSKSKTLQAVYLLAVTIRFVVVPF